MKSHLLRAEQRMRDWTRAKVTEAVGVDAKTIGRWERMPDMPVQTSFLTTPTIPQFPESTCTLIGRDGLLMQVKERLFAGHSLALTALGGLPGIGKTALALAVASDREIQEHFCDGILWAGLGPNPDVLEQLTRWGEHLGVVPSQVENINSQQAWRQALRAAIGSRRLLLVIDDAWTTEDALALQVGGPACVHLLTTRWSQVALTFDQEEAIVVRQLKEADGLALLAHFVPQLVEQDPQGAQALVWAMGGLPLALTLIGKYLACYSQTFIQQSHPLQALLELLHDTEQHLDKSTPPVSGQSFPGHAQTIPLYLHKAIAICDQQLSVEAHIALHALTSFLPKPHSFSEEAALAASQQPKEVLDTLQDIGLLETYGPGRYTLHQAVASYLRAQNQVPTAQQLTNPPVRDGSDTPLAKHSFFSQPLWNISLRRSNGIPIFRPPNSFSRHPLLIGAMILLAVLLIVAAPMTFLRKGEKQGSPSRTSTKKKETYGPPTYKLVIQNTDPSLQETAQNLQNVFHAVYPQLVNRFALHATSLKRVDIVFSSNLPSLASTNGTTITISSDWARQHPTDKGLLTYELTLVVEQYPFGTPAWFSDGMADYARSIYGPADDDWSLPNDVQPQDSYQQGGVTAARFLLWLEQHTRLDIVDHLNHALQTKHSFSDIFHYLTHHSVDELWSQYQAHPTITSTPEQLYKTVTSRKPLYQSTLRVQCFQPGTTSPIFALHQASHASSLYASNFAIQADMTIASGDGGGFIFRYQYDHKVEYRFSVSPDGTYRLENQSQTLLSGSNSAIKKGLNQTNQLTIIAQNHTIYLYINSQFLTKVDDNTSSYGWVGVIAIDNTNPADVQFKKVQIF